MFKASQTPFPKKTGTKKKDQFFLSLPSLIFLVIISLVVIYTRLPAKPEHYLWLDEAWRAVAIWENQSLPSLVKYMSTSSEVLMLSEWILGKIGFSFLGHNGFALRIIPIVFSVVAVISMYGAVKSLTRSEFGLLGAIFLATGSDFIIYSREFKPYALDLALCLSCIWVSSNYVYKPSRRQWIICVILLSIYSLSSLTSLFVIPGIILYLVLQSNLSKKRLLLSAGLPTVCFGLVYLMILRPQSPGGTVDFWRDYYFQNLPELWELSLAGFQAIQSYVFTSWWLIGVFYLIGVPLFSILRKDGVWLLLLTPLAIQIFFAGVQKYPLFGRPSYYLYGLFVLGSCYVLSCLLLLLLNRFGLNRKPKLVFLIQHAFVLTIALSIAFNSSSREKLKSAFTYPQDQGRAMMEILQDKFAVEDRLLYNYGSYFTLRFYRDVTFANNPILRDMQFIRGESIIDRDITSLCQALKTDSESFKDRQIIWFTTSHVPNAYQAYQKLLPQVGEVEIVLQSPKQSLIRLTHQQPFSDLECYGEF